MEESVNRFDLSPEQQDTASLLRRVLGKAIADRYVDFCRFAAGAFAVNASRPVAAHAMRELESWLRHVLAVPLETKAIDFPEDARKRNTARKQLTALGFDESGIQRAIEDLKPRTSHKAQIRKIVSRLGLDPDGDIARQWLALCDVFGKAHERSFNSLLKVDEEFRLRYQQPFDTVIRAVAVALERHYVTLMRRVEAIAVMADKAQAVEAFASEIPGALPLQWHFFEGLSTGDWLPHLSKAGLLDEPISGPDEGATGGMRYRQWPAGSYLKRMAQSLDADTRQQVVAALCGVAESAHPDIHQGGIEILAALPAEEAAPLADVAVTWIGSKISFGMPQAPEALLKKLAEGKQSAAVLRVARALLQLWDENGHIGNLYGGHMYEHHVPRFANWVMAASGEDGLRLLMDLLIQAAEISGKVRYDHYSTRAIGDDSDAPHDPYSALLTAVRHSAEMIIQTNPARMHSVFAIVTRHPSKIFVRLGMHVLAQNPAAAPDIAEAHLLNVELIEATWCQDEYALLACAWLPSLPADKQAQIMQVVDALPQKHLAAWRARFEEHRKTPPTAENERLFAAATIRDAVWKWRSVLVPERQAALDRTVAEIGDPDAWRSQMFPSEGSPLSGAEFSSRSVSEIAGFLRTWQPLEKPQRQTVTALAQELRTAVGTNPKLYASHADQFCNLRPIYVRRVLEGLQNGANNQRDLEWGKALKLVEFVYSQYDQPIDLATLAEGDDKSWTWACMTASEFLAAALRRGATGIGFEHAVEVRALVFTALRIAPRRPDAEDFEARFQRDSYLAAQATLRGIAVELAILLMFWLTKDTTTPLGSAPREALQNLPEIRNALEAQLADETPDGRVPRAIMGRFLGYLFYFGESWLMAQMPRLFPKNDDQLRHAAWRAHLGHGLGPLRELMGELAGCYAEDIALLASDAADKDFRDFYQERLADYVLILNLCDALPKELLEQFLQDAPADVRRHAMWFVGKQVASPPNLVPTGFRARGLAYWDLRLTEAIQSNNPDPYRPELGVIGQWCFHSRVEDEVWLCGQLLRMLKAGFAPSDAFSVVEWLAKMAPRQIDRAVEVMGTLLRYPQIDQWAYMTEREPIRAVLSEGLTRGTPETVRRVEEIVGFLSTLGETGYLDLLPPAAA